MVLARAERAPRSVSRSPESRPIPPPTAGADAPGGWPGVVYYRLHGAPRKYWSKYDARYLDVLENALHSVPPTVDAWCMFDNTASGAALENALELSQVLGIVPS